jgi:sulfate adenylyltransferase subunit 1
LEVIERHAPELKPTEVGTVVFSLKNEIAVDLCADIARLGRFVLEDGVHIGGGGIVRGVADSSGLSARRIDLGAKRIDSDEGNVIDLTRERGAVEFDVSAGFLDSLVRGNRVLFRLRDLSQLAPLGLLAFEHSLRFEFSRAGDRVNVVLYAGPQVGTSTRSGGGGEIVI